MKLLLTTDFHASQKALRGLDILLEQHAYKAVIMAGDLTNPQPAELAYAKAFIDLVKTKYQLPLFGLHGNNEPEEMMRLYRETDINIHLQTREWEGYHICGIGGFGTLDEKIFEDLSIENLVINEKTIFATHVPPQSSEPLTRGPLVHLYGHKHVLAYAKQCGPTLQIQCPAGILGRVTELTLPDLTVNFTDLPLSHI